MMKTHVARLVYKASFSSSELFFSTMMTNIMYPRTMSNIQNDIDKDSWKEKVISASESLLAGNIIGLPTDTIYGVAGLAQSTEAVKKLYSLKSRPSGNPVAICVGDVDDLKKWADVIISDDLLHKLLPGPVTLIFERKSCLNQNLNPDTKRVGIRIPDHEFIRQVCRLCGGPLALTSANISGCLSTLSVDEFSPKLRENLDVIVDGGRLGHSENSRLGSTVVDLSNPQFYTIVRPGSAREVTVSLLESYGLKEMSK